MMITIIFSDGVNIYFLACDDSSDCPTTELVFRGISKQIASVYPFIKEISALFKETSTQAYIDKCKTFLAAQIEECKTFVNSQIIEKCIGNDKFGSTKGKTCVIICSVQQ